MSKNLNNNYSSDSTTNLQIASLNTSISSINTQISNLATTSYVDSSVNTSYLQSYSAILRNNTLYIAPLLSLYMTSVLTNSLIANLISSNNTSQNLLRDTAITTGISSAKSIFLSSINTYTANQIFPSITTSLINYLGSFNSISLGSGCSPGVNSVTIGIGCLTNSSGVAIGSNTLIANIGVNNSVIGANCLIYNTTGKSNVALGQGCGTGNISGSNNCFIGAETNTTGQYNNSCAIGYASMITANNQIQLGSSNETVYCNKISTPNNQLLTYSTIPLAVSNQVGYQVSNSRTITINFTSGDSYINITLATLPVGIYIINYCMNIYSTTTTANVLEKSFIEYGISTTSTSNNIQQRKSYFSIPTSLSHSLTNTICYVSSGLTIFLNANLPASDLTSSSLTASRWSYLCLNPNRLTYWVEV